MRQQHRHAQLVEPRQHLHRQFGLPRFNAGSYVEYRPTFVQVGATTVNIGTGSGSGSGRIKHDAGSVACTWNVLGAGSSSEQGLPAVQLKGTNAANVLDVQKGTVGVALDAGSVSTLATLRSAAAVAAE